MKPQGGQTRARLTALVVEDNATDRSFFSEVLASRGHHVHACADGEAALEYLERQRADLVILDLQLPGIDGVEVCRRIRARGEVPDPFIIVVTSTEEADTLSGVLDAGADDFMKKPVDPSILMIRLRIAEARIRASRALAEAQEALDSRIHELETLHRLAELTLSATSLEEAYEQILELVSDAMGCSVVAIEHLDRDRDRLVITAARGIPAAENEELSIPLHRTLSGVAVRTGQPVVEHDPDSRKEHAAPQLTALGLRCYAAFPFLVHGEVTGTLLLADTEPRPMDERWVRLGTSLAATIASYLERLQAQEAIRESEQRYRILAAALQQANQELESFAYSVSHDLRAPLRTMQGFAHALLQNCGDELSDEARDYVRRIIASGEMAERLISDLLAYSRLSFEKWELSAVELEAVVQDALAQLSADIEQASAHVEVERPLPAVRGNYTALVQAVTNLVSNAIKFVPDERKPEVRIRAQRTDGTVRLRVEDNGVGIPPGQEERVFRVFERLADSGDRPGTGIGLAIVRRAVERMEGHCGVERLPDGGSAFWIELPAAETPPKRRGFWRAH